MAIQGEGNPQVVGTIEDLKLSLMGMLQMLSGLKLDYLWNSLRATKLSLVESSTKDGEFVRGDPTHCRKDTGNSKHSRCRRTKILLRLVLNYSSRIARSTWMIRIRQSPNPLQVSQKCEDFREECAVARRSGKTDSKAPHNSSASRLLPK